jgi:DNA-binding SARP family transcriptional activator/Tfp pilus assembly protein PilF
MSRLEFRVLGPVEALHGGRRIDIGHPRQRAVLAVLLLDLNHVVSAEQLIDRVWGEDPPVTVRNVLYGYVAGLRAALVRAAAPGSVLARRAGGYVLAADEDQLDLCRFRRLAAQGRLADPGEDAAQQLIGALALWRGEALAGLSSPWLEGVRRALSAQRMDAVACVNDIRLRQGEHAALAGELSELIARSPADERLAGQLMLALYRSGQPAEALRWFERTRLRLADELGADAGPELQALHRQILADDAALALPRRAGRQPELTPRELPADVAGFTGRAGQLAALDRLLTVPASGSGPAGNSTVRSKPTVVISALSGTAGVGKTALAIRWAHRAAERFPDGQLYVTLRGYDPAAPLPASEALAGFLRALGVASADIPADTQERAARYRSLVAGRRMLVVIDNASSAEQVRPLLPGTDSCVTVVTSRDSLTGLVARDGAWRLELDLMPEPDAVGLLRELIGARVDEEPAAAALLAAQCARLPLALRLAAELAVSRPEVLLADLARELADQRIRLDLLDAGGDSQSAVRAVFSWSVRHLDAESTRAFRLLGLHPGTNVDSCAAAALTGTSQKHAGLLLDQVRRAHLIQTAGPGRYAMHDLLGDYARELAAAEEGEDEQRAALTRLLDYYLHAAAAAMDTLYPAERGNRPDVPGSAVPAPIPSGDHGAARAWFDAERANLAAAATLAADHNWPGHATSLAGTVHRYLERGGYYGQAMVIHGAARRAARGAADLAAEANALVNLAIVDAHQGRYQPATGQLQLALTLFGEVGDEDGRARVLGNLGVIEFYQGRLTEADGHLRRALALHHRYGDVVNEGRMLGNLGTLNLRRGSYAQAKEYLAQAMRICKQTGNLTGEAHVSNILGEVALKSGEYRQGASHLQHALSLSRQTGDRAEQARILCDLGMAELRQGRAAQATSYLNQAMDLSTEIGEQSVMAEASLGLGEVHLAAGHVDMARRAYSDVLQLAGQIREPQLQARANDGLGRAHHAAGDHVRARQLWQESLTLYAELGAPEADQIRARLAQHADIPG